MLDALDPIFPDHDDDRWSIAGAEFRRHIDDDIRKRAPGGVLPQERKVAVGQIDYFKVHAYALDRLDELLGTVLPDGDFTDNGTAWRGRHDERAHWITVSLLSGEWFDPIARKRGNDLVGLIADVYRMSRRRAAIRLAQQLGIEAVRHG
jgi:hypothetical protein